MAKFGHELSKNVAEHIQVLRLQSHMVDSETLTDSNSDGRKDAK